VIHRGGQRGRELVRQIRSLSRQNEQEKKPVNMEAVLDECIKLLRPSFPASIEIRRKVLPGLGPVMADPTQMHQVIVNLCTNAAHAMAEQGGVLEISLANLDLDIRSAATFPELKPGPYLRLTVKDSGRGMPEEVLEHIFDPFFTTKGQGEGTGLGLSVVHGILKHHGGSIQATSEPGKGSKFQVYLPRIPGLAQTVQAETLQPAASGGGRILFVDDEEDIVFSGENMLTRLGYQVVSSRSAQEALELFRRQPGHYDLVITDLTMPQMSGDQLAEALVRLRPDIPIILCTGFGPGFRSTLGTLEMRSEGIREVVMKPFDRADMAQAIRRALT
jgi:CheY-like chemotaxis protein